MHSLHSKRLHTTRYESTDSWLAFVTSQQMATKRVPSFLLIARNAASTKSPKQRQAFSGLKVNQNNRNRLLCKSGLQLQSFKTVLPNKNCRPGIVKTKCFKMVPKLIISQKWSKIVSNRSSGLVWLLGINLIQQPWLNSSDYSLDHLFLLPMAFKLSKLSSITILLCTTDFFS